MVTQNIPLFQLISLAALMLPPPINKLVSQSKLGGVASLISDSVTHLQKVLTDFASVFVDQNKQTNYCCLPRAQPGVSQTQLVQYEASNRRDSTQPQVPGVCGRLPRAQERTWPLPKSPRVSVDDLPRPKSVGDAT